MLNRSFVVSTIIAATLTLGCSSQDVPPAHKGRMFDKTGGAALWVGGRGFEGDVLGPGTYFTGMYPEIRMVDCAQQTIKEPMTALTKDGVQFSLDVYVTYSANCDSKEAVIALLDKLSPEGTKSAKEGEAAPVADAKLTITSEQVYRVFIKPLIGEAVRVAVSPYIANDINAKREEIFEKIKKSFTESVDAQQGKTDDGKPRARLVTIGGLTLNNLDFPQSMDDANTERATQAILKDKSTAEQDKIKVEIETAKLAVERKRAEAQAEAAKIDVVGAALRRNPEYYIRDVYYYAAEKGGSVMLPGDPNVILQITPKAGR